MKTAIKFFRGTKENLIDVPIVAGQLLFTIDEGHIYFDISEDQRIDLYATALNQKQDELVFGTAYNAETNKAATMKDITAALGNLSGVMHFIGKSISDPTAEDGPSIMNYDKEFQPGDVCLYDAKEFVFDGEKWIELGDESSFAVKGSISDDDIAADAAISPSKIANLSEVIDALNWNDFPDE